jgi:hypothetical protein
MSGISGLSVAMHLWYYNQRLSFGPRTIKGIFIEYCHPYSLAYKILYAGKVYNSGHVYFLSSTIEINSTVSNDILRFFQQFSFPTAPITEPEIHSAIHETVPDRDPPSLSGLSVASTKCCAYPSRITSHPQYASADTCPRAFSPISLANKSWALLPQSFYYDYTPDIEHLNPIENQISPLACPFTALDNIYID